MGERFLNIVILKTIINELERAEILYPVWPAPGHRGDHVWAAGILLEEAGEVLKAALNWQAHNKGSVADMREEAIQTAAMAIRFLSNLDAVERQRINESARQELHEEHVIYVPPAEGLQLDEMKFVKERRWTPEQIRDASAEGRSYTANDAGEWVIV